MLERLVTFALAQRLFVIVGVLALIAAPMILNNYYLSLLIQIGFMGIAALGLNILVGYTGQISLGHAGFFGFGAFASAWLNNSFGVPVVLASRCIQGGVWPIYGYPGGAAGLKDRGVILAGGLPGNKARMKLMVGLGLSLGPAELAEMFEETGASGAAFQP